MTYFIAYILLTVLVAAMFSRCAELDRADERRERTERIIAIVREQQRTPRVVERNLAERLRAEMRRGRANQVALIYADIERN